MIKLVLWGVRKTGITHADYYQGNHVVHGDLVRNSPADFRAQIRRYTQSYVFDATYGGSAALPIDSVSELWYSSPEEAQANLAHPYYLGTILPDGANFADETRNIVHFAAEEVVGGQPLRGQGVKVLQYLRVNTGVSVETFESFWAAAHEDASTELGRLLGFARNHVPPGAPVPSGLAPTGYGAYWLDGRADIPSFQAYAGRLLELGKRDGVLDQTACFTLFCDERRVLDTEFSA